MPPEPAPQPTEDPTAPAQPDLELETPVEGEEGEPQGGDTGEGQPAPEPAPKSTAADRIRDLIAERKAVEEYAEYWRERALKGAPPPPKEPDEPKPAPTIEQFNGDVGRWSVAHAKWTEEQIEQRAAAVVEQQLQESRRMEARKSTADSFQERLKNFAKDKADAALVIQNPRLNISETMRDVILESPEGPAIAYHLGMNPAEATRISRMSPVQAAAAMGRLEAQLATTAPPGGSQQPGSGQPPPKPKQLSRAPEPPKPVGGASAPSVDLESCSLDDFLAARLGRRR